MISLFKKFKQGLTKTAAAIADRAKSLFAGRAIDASSLEALEEALYTADFGVATTTEILEEIKRAHQKERELRGQDAARIGAAVLRVPLALPLGILVFLGSFIPIIGAVLTGSVAVLVALVAQGPFAAIVMLAVVLVVQQVEGHVMQPFLMGHAVSLHPVAVLLSVAAGSLVAGITGALFAVPVAAVINTVLLYLHGHDKFPELGTEDHVAIRAQATPANAVPDDPTPSTPMTNEATDVPR